MLMKDSFPILFGSRWRARGLDTAIASVDHDALCVEYSELRRSGPRRSRVGRPYFVGHSGVATTAGSSSRLEEHCAIALVNFARHWPRPDGGWFRLLDYQVPLKARQSDVGIGKIDLLGVTEQGRLVVIELKVVGAGGGRGDSPPAALMEGLRYAAILETDQDAIIEEAERRFGVQVTKEPPIVLLLATEAWWRAWLELQTAGDWGPAFARLAKAVETRTDVSIEYMALRDPQIDYGMNGKPPRFDRAPALCAVELFGERPIGEPLSVLAPAQKDTATYVAAVQQTLWGWADQHHANRLDGGHRKGRSPVLQMDFAELNVLVPPDESTAEKIRAAISSDQRHRHFASLRSSQALAQSVFGAIDAHGRLDLLAGVTGECGRPAFFRDDESWTLGFEQEVRTLAEPRPTSVDVFLSRSDQRVAVECKFTEQNFGTCSRPRLRPGDPTYAEQYCDGNYRPQAGRSDRCALTAIGVTYWDHLPSLFAWPADRDHAPCPFEAVYQLARNVLAAVLTPDGELDPAGGHALIVYDARNPAFMVGGEADRQWEAAVAACLVPGLLRRLSWQRLLAFMATAPELAWLVTALGAKYGLVSNSCSE
jgi:hypothetical protein